MSYSDHLVALLARCEAAGVRIAKAAPEHRASEVASARVRSARLSARLDASPLLEETADAVDRRLAAGEPPLAAGEHAPEPGPTERGLDGVGGWGRALKLEGMPSEDVAAVEYSNLLRTFEVEAGLAAAIFERPLEVLAELHGHIADGLVEPEVIGRLRRTDQAVHDGAQGLVVYHASAPERLEGLMGELAGWLGQGSALLPTVVVAGIVHERILEWHPFEAANGRLARAASRLVLRARGLDTDGVAVPEAQLARDALGYYAEVAATIRRGGDLTAWSERWAEAVCRGLEDAADRLDPCPPTVLPPRAAAVVEALGEGAVLTVPEYEAQAGVRRETAMADLRALERAEILEVVPRSGGLRWRRRERVSIDGP